MPIRHAKIGHNQVVMRLNHVFERFDPVGRIVARKFFFREGPAYELSHLKLIINN